MKKIIILAGFALLAAACSRQPMMVAPSPLPINNYTHRLLVGNKILDVEIVSDAEKMRQGLSGRTFMAENQGMLFDFGQLNSTAFWMKDMKFNLDFIWINKNKIVGITADAPAPVKDKGLEIKDGNLPLYYPPSPIDMVLEVNAGWSGKNKIKIGTEVNLK